MRVAVLRLVRSDPRGAPEWRGGSADGMRLTRAVVDTSTGRVLLCAVQETIPRRRHGSLAIAGFFDASRRPSSPGRRSFPVGSARVQSVAVAKRYARALADYAETAPREAGSPGKKDPARLDQVASDLTLVSRVLDADPKFARFFADPSVPQKNKLAAIEALERKSGLCEAVRNFLNVLVINRRLSALDAIRAAFEKVRDERLGIVSA